MISLESMGQHEFGILCEEVPAHVFQSIVSISLDVKVAITRILAEKGDVCLESGPYRTFPLEQPWADRWCDAGLFADRGPIPQHIDGAGDTMGLVIINEGNHRLKIGSREWDMPEGSLFHINSDLEHGTECDEPSGLLAFITVDFGWKKPLPKGVTYKTLAKTILEKVTLGI